MTQESVQGSLSPCHAVWGAEWTYRALKEGQWCLKSPGPSHTGGLTQCAVNRHRRRKRKGGRREACGRSEFRA